jgi:hypothetical protein
MIHGVCMEIVRHVLDVMRVFHMLLLFFPRESHFGASGACLWLELCVCDARPVVYALHVMFVCMSSMMMAVCHTVVCELHVVYVKHTLP